LSPTPERKRFDRKRENRNAAGVGRSLGVLKRPKIRSRIKSRFLKRKTSQICQERNVQRENCNIFQASKSTRGSKTALPENDEESRIKN